MAITAMFGGNNLVNFVPREQRKYGNLSDKEFLFKMENDMSFRIEIMEEMVLHWLINNIAHNVATEFSFEKFEDECWELCGAIGREPRDIWNAALTPNIKLLENKSRI